MDMILTPWFGSCVEGAFSHLILEGDRKFMVDVITNDYKFSGWFPLRFDAFAIFWF